MRGVKNKGDGWCVGGRGPQHCDEGYALETRHTFTPLPQHMRSISKTVKGTRGD